MERNKQSQSAGDNSTQMQGGTINNYTLNINIGNPTPIQDISCVKEEDSRTEILFSNEEVEVITKWVKSKNAEGVVVCFEYGGSSYFLGDKEYKVSEGREMANWEDFMERLLKISFIELDKYNSHGNPVYKLKKAAYDYVDTVSGDKNQLNEG